MRRLRFAAPSRLLPLSIAAMAASTAAATAPTSAAGAAKLKSKGAKSRPPRVNGSPRGTANTSGLTAATAKVATTAAATAAAPPTNGRQEQTTRFAMRELMKSYFRQSKRPEDRRREEAMAAQRERAELMAAMRASSAAALAEVPTFGAMRSSAGGLMKSDVRRGAAAIVDEDGKALPLRPESVEANTAAVSRVTRPQLALDEVQSLRSSTDDCRQRFSSSSSSSSLRNGDDVDENPTDRDDEYDDELDNDAGVAPLAATPTLGDNERRLREIGLHVNDGDGGFRRSRNNKSRAEFDRLFDDEE